MPRAAPPVASVSPFFAGPLPAGLVVQPGIHLPFLSDLGKSIARIKRGDTVEQFHIAHLRRLGQMDEQVEVVAHEAIRQNLKHPAPACRAGLGLSGHKAGGTRLSRPFAPLTLPQNTQNGLRPSRNTQKHWGCRGMEAGGLGVLCLLCVAKRLQCV